MRTYQIKGTNGRMYTLSGIVDNVKLVIEDIVQSRERVRLHRQLKKKLIDMEVFTMSQQSVSAMHFLTEPVLLYISTVDGAKALIREQIANGGRLPEPTDADVDAVYEAQKEENSEAWVTIRQIWSDAYPKGQTPPPSMASETSGEGSFTMSQSI